MRARLISFLYFTGLTCDFHLSRKEIPPRCSGLVIKPSCLPPFCIPLLFCRRNGNATYSPDSNLARHLPSQSGMTHGFLNVSYVPRLPKERIMSRVTDEWLDEQVDRIRGRGGGGRTVTKECLRMKTDQHLLRPLPIHQMLQRSEFACLRHVSTAFRARTG